MNTPRDRCQRTLVVAFACPALAAWVHGWHRGEMAPATNPRRRIRWGVVALVLGLHGVAAIVLVRAFTPEFAENVARTMTHAFDIQLVPPPEPAASPSLTVPKSAPATKPGPKGAAGAAGRRAAPREAAAPPAVIVLAPTQAPPIVGAGKDNAAGSSLSGAGTGSGGQGAGSGAGSGGAGSGGGGGVVHKPVKIAGDINSARDYPRESRDLRLGHQVVVILRVGTDGRVKSCRIAQPSPDDEANRITCNLATQRFRFRPARDGAGNPVEADYGWRQRWFLTGEE